MRYYLKNLVTIAIILVLAALSITSLQAFIPHADNFDKAT